MSGPPPPLGQPWNVNVGNNPEMTRDPPPPSLNHVPGFMVPPASAGAAAPPIQQQVHVEHDAPAAVHQVRVEQQLPAMGLGIGIGPPLMMGMGMGMGMGMPISCGPFFGGPPPWSAGPLGPPRDPWNTPGLMGNPSSWHGSRNPLYPHLGFPAGAPPPPPGIELGGAIPPFAPGVPLWAGGVVPGLGAGLGGMGMGMGMGMGLGMGLGGMWPGMNRPAPAVITEATGNAQPKQVDISEIPGGIPPGATHVESGEHTIVHLLRSSVPPWLNPGMPMEVEVLHLASTTGLNRMIQVCNNNQDSEHLAISECHEMVNGVWEKGQTFMFNDTMCRVLTIKDAGWDNKRNRPGGQSLHIFLHRV